MRLNSNRVCGWCALSAMMALAGCATKKPVPTANPAFRLRTLGGSSLLFAPSVPATQTDGAPIPLRIQVKPGVASSSSACSSRVGAFRLDNSNLPSSELRIDLPAPDRWLAGLEGSPAEDGQSGLDSLSSFLAALDRAQAAGCFADGAESTRNYVLESIPMRPAEGLFNAYGYRLERSGVDLKSGLRIKIVRAYFAPAAAGEPQNTIQNYLGLSTLLFDVKAAGGGGVGFEQAGEIQYAPQSVAKFSEKAEKDQTLHGLSRQPHYRVLFYTYLVPKERRISAAIIGAAAVEQLDELEQSLRARPELGCQNTAVTREESCLEFDGTVTLTTQVGVELNGRPEFVDWGTRAGDLVPNKSVKTLRIKRRFMEACYEVIPDASDPQAADLVLVGGDQLTWNEKSQSGP